MLKTETTAAGPIRIGGLALGRRASPLWFPRSALAGLQQFRAERREHVQDRATLAAAGDEAGVAQAAVPVGITHLGQQVLARHGQQRLDALLDRGGLTGERAGPRPPSPATPRLGRPSNRLKAAGALIHAELAVGVVGDVRVAGGVERGGLGGGQVQVRRAKVGLELAERARAEDG